MQTLYHVKPGPDPKKNKKKTMAQQAVEKYEGTVLTNRIGKMGKKEVKHVPNEKPREKGKEYHATISGGTRVDH